MLLRSLEDLQTKMYAILRLNLPQGNPKKVYLLAS
jgi:hypothetical protein